MSAYSVSVAARASIALGWFPTAGVKREVNLPDVRGYHIPEAGE